jgi:hypothetical protein
MPVTRKIFTDVMGGSAATNFIGNTGDIFYDQTSGELRISDGVTAGGISVQSASSKAHGCFHKVSTVTAAANNTAYSFDWHSNTTVHVGDSGISVASGQPTHVVIDTAGDYVVNLLMHIKITGNATREVFLWLAKNGSDIPETGVKVALRAGTVENPIFETLAKQWFLHNIAADDYIELRFAISRVDLIELEYTAAQTEPYIRPALPSAIFTVYQI